MIIVTSFAKINVQEGVRLTYSYSEVGEDGSLINEDGKGSYIVLDGTETAEHLKVVENEIKGRIEQK